MTLHSWFYIKLQYNLLHNAHTSRGCKVHRSEWVYFGFKAAQTSSDTTFNHHRYLSPSQVLLNSPLWSPRSFSALISLRNSDKEYLFFRFISSKYLWLLYPILKLCSFSPVYIQKQFPFDFSRWSYCRANSVRSITSHLRSWFFLLIYFSFPRWLPDPPCPSSLSLPCLSSSCYRPLPPCPPSLFTPSFPDLSFSSLFPCSHCLWGTEGIKCIGHVHYLLQVAVLRWEQQVKGKLCPWFCSHLILGS